MGPVNPKVMTTPDADIPMIFDSPKEREMREGIHHEDRERAFQEGESISSGREAGCASGMEQ